MWRYVLFTESFKGRRIIGKKETIEFIREVVNGVKQLAPFNNNNNTCTDDILKNLLIDQCVIQDVFVPAISSATEEQDFIPHLAGLIFFNYDQMYDQHIYAMLRSLRGNKRVLQTMIVPDNQIDHMFQSYHNRIIETKPIIQKGSLVEILDGSYKGLIGRVETIKDNNICSVNIQIFGRVQSLDININEIQLTDSEV